MSVYFCLGSNANLRRFSGGGGVGLGGRLGWRYNLPHHLQEKNCHFFLAELGLSPPLHLGNSMKYELGWSLLLYSYHIDLIVPFRDSIFEIMFHKSVHTKALCVHRVFPLCQPKIKNTFCRLKFHFFIQVLPLL